MNDLAIKEFEAQLVQTINAANVPLEVKRLVLAEIYGNLIAATNNMVDQQIKEREQQATAEEESTTEPEVVEE